MKVKFNSNQSWSEVILEPETPEETTALMRMALNSKQEKPIITFHLRDKPELYMFLDKRAIKLQTFAVNPRTKQGMQS